MQLLGRSAPRHLLRALPGGHIVLVVLLHPDALDPEVVGSARDRDPPAPSTRVYTYKQQQHRGIRLGCFLRQPRRHRRDSG